MSILIKGMEMPKNDDDYVIFTVYGDGGVVYGPLNRSHMRYKHCAVPLPEGHGRLIDADKLMKEEQVINRFHVVSACDVIIAPTIVPAEGCGEADKKTNCSDCGNRNTPVCKYCEHDAEGGNSDGN